MNDTPDCREEQELSPLEAALEYDRRGWSIIPIEAGTKKPACRKSKQYQNERPSKATLKRWFNTDKQYGLALALPAGARRDNRRG
jgi:hypothetical protein